MIYRIATMRPVYDNGQITQYLFKLEDQLPIQLSTGLQYGKIGEKIIPFQWRIRKLCLWGPIHIFILIEKIHVIKVFNSNFNT